MIKTYYIRQAITTEEDLMVAAETPEEAETLAREYFWYAQNAEVLAISELTEGEFVEQYEAGQPLLTDTGDELLMHHFAEEQNGDPSDN